MNLGSTPVLNDKEILDARPPRQLVDPWRPYGVFNEPELQSNGLVEEVTTILLTNRECPFHCVMCDLWQYTTTETVPAGAIPTQIDDALAGVPPTQHIKLYNGGNFFDSKAIPVDDHAAIAKRVRHYKTVIVENHPRLCSPSSCARFRDRLEGRFEIALGLETANPEVLKRLNKRMDLNDFRSACQILTNLDIDIRSFVILAPPYQAFDQAVQWAVRSVQYAVECGARCVSIVPSRAGNGIVERLQHEGLFKPPTLTMMEEAFLASRDLVGDTTRVFIDLWDADRFGNGTPEDSIRINRLHCLNRGSARLP